MKPILTFLALPAAALFFSSCDTTPDTPAEAAAEQQADALEDRADAVRDADNSGALGTTGDAAERRADELEDQADEVRDAAE